MTSPHLFHLSTSAALVAGVFDGAISMGELRTHGDFGLGTFHGLDGEMILLEGTVFRAGGGGLLTTVDDDATSPFAVVTHFDRGRRAGIRRISSMEDLSVRLDGLRQSDNAFYAIRIDGGFEHLAMRAAAKADRGEGLLAATRHQSKYEAADVHGTMVGFWSPGWSASMSVPGYHFHFVDGARSLGGHVFDAAARDLAVQILILSDVRWALPENEAFRTAHLDGDHRATLHEAETGSKPRGDRPSGSVS